MALIVRAPEPVSVTRLTDLLWGDDPPKNPDNALQTQISYLRKALTPAGGPPLIVTEAEIEDSVGRLERACAAISTSQSKRAAS